MEKNLSKKILLQRRSIGLPEEENLCCSEQNISPKDGNLVCTNCGTVIGTELIGVEQRAFTTEEVNNRKRTEKRWRDIGPRTFIGKEKIDSRGNVLQAQKKTLYNRLGKIQSSLIDSLERNKWEAKPQLEQLASKLNIPAYVKETAWRIYTAAAKKKLTMGRSIIGFIAASLYASIRIHELPRLLEEVCDSELVPRRPVHQALGLLLKDVLPTLGLKYKPITSRQLVYRFGNDLKLPINVQKNAIDMLETAAKKGLNNVGKDPRGLAASAIYIAAKNSKGIADRRTQAEISEIAKITEVTLRSRAKDIRKYLIKA